MELDKLSGCLRVLFLLLYLRALVSQQWSSIAIFFFFLKMCEALLDSSHSLCMCVPAAFLLGYGY